MIRIWKKKRRQSKRRSKYIGRVIRDNEIIMTNGSPNIGQTTRPYYNQQRKKRTCRIVNFDVPADHKVKLKVSEKKDDYLDLARELKKKKQKQTV